MLLEAGSDIEAKVTGDVSTPLHLAAYRRMRSSGTIRALLESGANVNTRDAYGATPLHDACSQSCATAVEALLLWGADEKLADEDENTLGDVVGTWEQEFEDDSDEGGYKGQRKADDDERIHRMLARAPDRFWRRRG